MAELTEDQKRIADLEKQVATLTADNEKKAAELIQAQGIVTTLKEKLSAQEAESPKSQTLKIGSESYEFTSEFFYDGQEITVELLKDDTKLAQKLVKEGVGNLKKVKA